MKIGMLGTGIVVKEAFYSFWYFVVILFCFCNEDMFMYYWYNFKTKPKKNDTGL